mgnify:FL=1
MDKYIFDESNGLWYELQGDYYIPFLILSEEKTQPIGLWGQRHREYLRRCEPSFSSPFGNKSERSQKTTLR